MNIVLLGYRGSGKTSIGRRLADQLWKDFVDTDQRVCARFGGATIREIWEQHGEPAFREAECAVVAELLQLQEQVIALGGGTLMQPAAREAVEHAPGCRRIYLKCDPAVLARRIAADTATADARPNLTHLGGGGGLQEIAAVLAEREPVYESVADATFDVTYVTVDDAAAHIIRKCL